jgi:ABC-type tungstate transport system substrate-binding protein
MCTKNRSTATTFTIFAVLYIVTTAITLETSRGQNARAIALGIILLAMTFAVNLVLTVAQQRRAR